MLLILKKYFRPDCSPIYSDMTVQRNVPRFCTRSICGGLGPEGGGVLG